MLLFDSQRKTATTIRPTAMGFDPHHWSHRKALRLGFDVSIVVAALIIWALLSHLNWSQFWKPDTVEDCVYLGRAGSHCLERAPSREGDGATTEPNCESHGRAGRFCTHVAPSP